MSRVDLPKTVTQRALLRLFPEGEGLTTTEAFDAAVGAGLPADMTADGPVLCGFSFLSVLKYMRRSGWLICDKRTDPHEWVRTPMGDTFCGRRPHRPAKLTAAPRPPRRQEVSA